MPAIAGIDRQLWLCQRQWHENPARAWCWRVQLGTLNFRQQFLTTGAKRGCSGTVTLSIAWQSRIQTFLYILGQDIHRLIDLVLSRNRLRSGSAEPQQ